MDFAGFRARKGPKIVLDLILVQSIQPLHRSLLILFISCTLSVSPSSSFAMQSSPYKEIIRKQLRQKILQLKNIDISVRQTFRFHRVISSLYRQRDYHLIWTTPGLQKQLIAGLNSSYEDGLNPNDYDADKLVRLFSQESGGIATLVSRDVSATRNLLKLLDHLYYGKVDPFSINSAWNMKNVSRMSDFVSTISDALSSENIDALINLARPARKEYKILKIQLAHYRRLEAAQGWPTIKIDRLIFPDQESPVVGDLRKRLVVSGDYRAESVPDKYFRYDSELSDGVKAFQRRHLLKEDGVLGPKTIAALNISVQEKITKIRANLERMRWIFRALEPNFVLVDIAGYQVHLYLDDERIWSSRAQVGRPFRQTPIFKSAISYLEWNPDWTVPPTILRRDILPALQEDSAYLQEHNFSVVDVSGLPVDPSIINWGDYSGSDFPYKLRQSPGPKNALGRVKFIFPNHYSVYLHDTPSKSLFDEDIRAFSSGCIRIDRPYELAEKLLVRSGMEDVSGWIQNTIDQGKTQRQYLAEPIPILLFYRTTSLLPDGKLSFVPDIYNRDGKLIAALDSKIF